MELQSLLAEGLQLLRKDSDDLRGYEDISPYVVRSLAAYSAQRLACKCLPDLAAIRHAQHAHRLDDDKGDSLCDRQARRQHLRKRRRARCCSGPSRTGYL